MRSILSIGASLLALASTTLALAIPAEQITPVDLEERQTVCTNGPTTRSCWKNGFSTATNWYTKVPTGGKTVKYTLTVTSVQMAPDGFMREMMVFNNQYPGPLIEADWGDTLEITVVNNLPNNGTSIHWHGFRQLNSNQMDGTNGITECPIAPGQSKVYTFKATEYGASWYHSHYSIQYADGLVGPIIIYGPSTSNYDVDGGIVALTDWFHLPAFTILASRPAAPPLAQNVLVNGKGVYSGGGSYSTITLQPGKKNKLRFVNTGSNAYIHISMDGHPFLVIASDFVPIKPFVATSLVLTVGQRYDVIVNANQTAGNYWFRVGLGANVNGPGRCDGPNEKLDNLGAIINYAGTPVATPTSTGITIPLGCYEETSIVPFLALNAGTAATAPTGLTLTLDTTAGVFWKVNGLAIHIDWTNPSLEYIQNGTYTLPADDNGLGISGANQWVYWLLQNNTPLPHPIHLHGHDFYVVAVGSGDGSGAALSYTNPIRRDTHHVAANGYSVIGFKSDNPGAWLMHCHIPFHISGGLGVQFLERPTEIIGAIGDLSGFNQGCNTWTTYQNSIPNFDQGDSGL